jgi:hypothetical protein
VGSLDFFANFEAKCGQKSKKMFYKCVLEFHLAFISGLEDSISSKKVQNLCSAVHTPASFFPVCQYSLISMFVILLLFISGCLKICHVHLIQMIFIFFISSLNSIIMQQSIIFNLSICFKKINRIEANDCTHFFL